MDTRLAASGLFVQLLILLGPCIGDARELAKARVNQESHGFQGSTSVLRLHSMDTQAVQQESQQMHSSSHMNHMDASVIVFFLLDDLKLGKTMPIFFRRPSPSAPHPLPKEEADAIPFSLASLPNLLHLFSFPQGSRQAKAMEATLKECETEPIKGETKLCSTSVESMLDFVQGALDAETNIKTLSTSHLTESSSDGLQIYTIMETPEEVFAPKMVACHTMPYPYVIYYCHHQVSESKVFQVSLRSEQGDEVEAVALCHMDTSQWSRNHVSFSVLGIEPGSSPVCHFLPADNLVFVSE